MEVLYKKDSYDTSDNPPRRFLDWILFKCRWSFYLRYFKLILRINKAIKKEKYRDTEWCESSEFVLKLAERCGANCHFRGIDNVKNAAAPIVYIANHMSVLETHILPVLIEPYMDVTFVVKQSLMDHTFFGPVMRSRRPITVSRKNAREDLKAVLEQGTELLKSGRSIIIFPQSSRSADFSPQHFNTLGVKLASRAGVKVVPIALKTDFWANGHKVKDFGPIKPERDVYITFGAPMEITGNGRKQHEIIIDFIQKNLDEWGKTK